MFAWPKQDFSSLQTQNAIRQLILESIHIAKSGHPGGSLSLVELMCAIFHNNFEHDSKDPQKADRDRLVLSKGHGVPALYAAYSKAGYFDPNEMKNLRRGGHFLQGHPDRRQYSLMEASTGSLGQGVSVALGLALALRLKHADGEIKRLPRVYCIVGDGEIQEGQVWEAFMAASKYQLANLIFILDYNKGQIDGPVAEVMDLEPIEDKMRAFGMNVKRVDGHDFKKLQKDFSELEIKTKGKPYFFVADTIKGKGVDFMEGEIKWHGVAPTTEELKTSLAQIYKSETGALPNGSLIGESA